jgi:hypothetical protein
MGQYDFTIEMALVDYIPVILFAIAGAILAHDLKNKMGGLNFLLFNLGIWGVFAAGACKATWKMLIAANIADIQILNKMFFPTQSIGFLLAGIGILAMIIAKKNRVYGVNTFVFIGMMVAGLGLLDAVLCVLAAKLKKGGAVIIFILSFICSLCMGYLSSQDFAEAIWNWIAEAINVIGQGTLLIGVVMLHKNGLKELKL